MKWLRNIPGEGDSFKCKVKLLEKDQAWPIGCTVAVAKRSVALSHSMFGTLGLQISLPLSYTTLSPHHITRLSSSPRSPNSLCSKVLPRKSGRKAINLSKLDLRRGEKEGKCFLFCEEDTLQNINMFKFAARWRRKNFVEFVAWRLFQESPSTYPECIRELTMERQVPVRVSQKKLHYENWSSTGIFFALWHLQSPWKLISAWFEGSFLALKLKPT